MIHLHAVIIEDISSARALTLMIMMAENIAKPRAMITPITRHTMHTIVPVELCCALSELFSVCPVSCDKLFLIPVMKKINIVFGVTGGSVNGGISI